MAQEALDVNADEALQERATYNVRLRFSFPSRGGRQHLKYCDGICISCCIKLKFLLYLAVSVNFCSRNVCDVFLILLHINFPPKTCNLYCFSYHSLSSRAVVDDNTFCENVAWKLAMADFYRLS